MKLYECPRCGRFFPKDPATRLPATDRYECTRCGADYDAAELDGLETWGSEDWDGMSDPERLEWFVDKFDEANAQEDLPLPVSLYMNHRDYLAFVRILEKLRGHL